MAFIYFHRTSALFIHDRKSDYQSALSDFANKINKTIKLSFMFFFFEERRNEKRYLLGEGSKERAE